VDGLFFFFSFELSYQREPSKPHRDGAREVRRVGLTKTYCRPRIPCAEWSRALLNNSPRHHSRSGRDWPHNAVLRSQPPIATARTGSSKADQRFARSTCARVGG
jgi:hypothetical protein